MITTLDERHSHRSDVMGRAAHFIEEWNFEKHIPLVRTWLDAVESAEMTVPERYPRRGCVVDRRCIGLIYQTDAPHVASLAVMMDPRGEPSLLQASLDVLLGALVARAREAGARIVSLATCDATLAALCPAHGLAVLQTNLTSFVTKESR